jgi:hypothetical protein
MCNHVLLMWVQHATGGILPTLVTGLDMVFQVRVSCRP